MSGKRRRAPRGQPERARSASAVARQTLAARPADPVEEEVLAHHHSAPVELPPGWSRPQPEHVPRPTYWPAVLALGVTFMMWGIVTSYFISLVGAVLLAIALAGWIREWRHGD